MIPAVAAFLDDLASAGGPALDKPATWNCAVPDVAEGVDNSSVEVVHSNVPKVRSRAARCA